jgi:hypothetical protein
MFNTLKRKDPVISEIGDDVEFWNKVKDEHQSERKKQFVRDNVATIFVGLYEQEQMTYSLAIDIAEQLFDEVERRGY